MPQTRYKPNSDPISLVFSSTGGSYFSVVDEDPTTPNLSDYLDYTPGAAPATEYVELGIEVPTIPPEGMSVRTYDLCTGNPLDVVMTEILLLDDSLATAASWTGSAGVGTGGALQDTPLTYIPGSYNWASARIRIKYEWAAVETLTLYAVDLVVGYDDTVGPGGQQARSAAHHQMMI